MPEKHGVIILEHKDWNTKQIWNRGHLMMTYRYVPKKLHFKSRMVNDKNQDLCGGWFIEGDIKEGETVDDAVVRRLMAGKKPMGILHHDEKKWAEIDAQELRDGQGYPRSLAADVVKKPNGWDVVAAQHGTLVELFDLDALAQDYIDNEIFTPDDMARMVAKYSHHDLIDFAEGWDVEDVPAWVTGLILGYPVENTISLYRMGNLL